MNYVNDRLLRAILAGAIALVGTVLTGCGGDRAAPVSTVAGASSSSSSSGGTGTDAIPPIPDVTTATLNLSVSLPSGMTVSPEKLKVMTSAASATPDASGAVSLPAFTSGYQIAIVASPAGNSMLMAWVDATHTTINAETTAEVMAYFALQGHLVLHAADADGLITGMPQAAGIQTIAAAIASELAANADAFAAADAKVSQAVADFVSTTLTVVTTATPASQSQVSTLIKAHRHALISDTDVHSGMTLIQDPPFSAHLSNIFRRRAYAFVERVSSTTAGVTTPDPMEMATFEVPPTSGVTGGATGAISDIIAAYFQYQPTAYGPVTAPAEGPFNVPLVTGADQTDYQVIVVGPGTNDNVVLTDAQKKQQLEVSLRGFMMDYFVPLFSNVVLGSGAVDFQTGQSTNKAKFIADLTASATTDFVALFGAAGSTTAVYDKVSAEIQRGDYLDATIDLANTAASNNTLRTILNHAFSNAVANNVSLPPGETYTVVADFFDHFNNILNVSSAGLSVIDAGFYAADIYHSDSADVWNVSAVPSKVKLNPQPLNIVGQTVATLTATALGADTQAGYSYHWTATSNAGDMTDLANNGALHSSDFCSSSTTAKFNIKVGAAQFAHDVVTVEAYKAAGCGGTSSPNYLGTDTDIVTYVPIDSLVFTPDAVQAKAGDVVNFSVALATPLTDNTLALSYHWALSGNAGGSLTDPITGMPSQAFDTPNATATYTAPATVTPNTKDTVTATLTVTLPWEDNLHFVTATGSANVAFGGPLTVGIAPQNPPVAQGALQTFTVSATTGAFPSGAKFVWTLTCGNDLFGGARDLGLWGGGSIGTDPISTDDGAAKGTSQTVTTSTPSIVFAENGFGPSTWGPDSSWEDLTNLAVQVTDASGNVLQSASTLIQTQTPRDIILP